MGMRKKKYTSGAAVSYITRKQALKKLQVTLPDFRRLCILKGIYPKEPKNKKQAGHGSTAPKTYYLAKDIRFLLSEPVLNSFREFKAFMKKIRKAKNRREFDVAGQLATRKPFYNLDHIVRERYPTFIDAVRELDDVISMCCLFATFPQLRSARSHQINLCKRLTVEFMHYVISSHSLRKVFVSIKGIYLQVEIMGQTITWVMPHHMGFRMPHTVDLNIMSTFVDFYCTLLGFVNFKLYNTLGIHYPPSLEIANEPQVAEDEEMCTKRELTTERLSALTQSLKSSVTSAEDADLEIDQFPSVEGEDTDIVEKAKLEAEELKKFQKLFANFKFFLNREVPRETLTFCLRSFGGKVSWEKTLSVGYSYQEQDETITHQIVDRPKIANQYLSRYYVQPQWVFDSINARRLLPVEHYFPGATLPPHLSPFVEQRLGDYMPPEQRALMGETVEESDDEEEIIDDDDDNSEEEEEEEDEEAAKDEKHLALAEKEHAAQQQQQRRKRKMADPEADDDVAPPETAAAKSGKKRSKGNNKDERKAKMAVSGGRVERDLRHVRLADQEVEEKKLSEMMIPKKKRQLYNRIVTGNKRRSKEVRVLEAKRKNIDEEQKILKKKAKKQATA